MVALAYQPEPYITLEEYAEIERQSEWKHEWCDGVVRTMAGASWTHNLIATNILRELSNQLRGKPCRPSGSDQRVQVPATGMRAYPDVLVACPPHQWNDQTANTLLNPKVIVEILSPSTEAYDRGAKFENYRHLESLTDYLLVSSDRIKVDHLRRQSDGSWLLRIATADDTIHLEAVECRLRVSDIYEDTELAAASVAE